MTLDKIMETATKDTKKHFNTDQKKKEEYDILCRVHDLVCVKNKDVKDGEWIETDLEYINNLQLLTAKPMVYLCNVSESEYVAGDNIWIEQINEWIQMYHPQDILIPFSGTIESALDSMTDVKEKNEYLKDLQDEYGSDAQVTSALPKIIVDGFKSLQLIRCKPIKL